MRNFSATRKRSADALTPGSGSTLGGLIGTAVSYSDGLTLVRSCVTCVSLVCTAVARNRLKVRCSAIELTPRVARPHRGHVGRSVQTYGRACLIPLAGNASRGPGSPCAGPATPDRPTPRRPDRSAPSQKSPQLFHAHADVGQNFAERSFGDIAAFGATGRDYPGLRQPRQCGMPGPARPRPPEAQQQGR